MKLTVEITAKRSKSPSSRERQSFNAELASALKLVADRIANTGAPDGDTPFAVGDVKGSYSVTGANV